MIRRVPIGLVAAFLVGFLLTGLPHWSLPGDGVGPTDPGTMAGLAGLTVIAMMLIVGQMATPQRSWLVMALCYPAAVAAPLVIAAPTATGAHALWPLDLTFALAAGAAAVAPGILAGCYAHRLQSQARG